MSKFNLLLIDDDILVHETAKTEFADTDINLYHASLTPAKLRTHFL